MAAPSKLYYLSFETRPEYLYAFAKGDIAAPDTRVELWTEIIARCRRDKYDKLLVVQDSPGNATSTDAFTSSAGIVSLGLEGIKIAYVDLDPANHQINQFGELVASNRGANAKVFTNEAEAIAWLI